MLDGIQRYFLRRSLDKVRDEVIRLGTVDTKLPIYAQSCRDELERGNITEAKKYFKKVQTELEEYKSAAKVYGIVVEAFDAVRRIENLEKLGKKEDK